MVFLAVMILLRFLFVDYFPLDAKLFKKHNKLMTAV